MPFKVLTETFIFGYDLPLASVQFPVRGVSDLRSPPLNYYRKKGKNLIYDKGGKEEERGGISRAQVSEKGSY